MLGPFPPTGLTAEVLSASEMALSWEDQELSPNALPPPDRTYTVKYGRHGLDADADFEVARAERTSIRLKGSHSCIRVLG